MTRMRKLFWVIMGLFLFAAFPQMISHADAPEPGIPPGFHLILSKKGVELYRKDYPKGNPDFVQRINLSQGAVIELLHGDISETRADKGVYGGNDPRFQSKSLTNYWRGLSADNPNAFCVTNGQFFYMKEYPTRLPFPLKKDGKVISDGYGIKQFPDQKLILEIWPDHVDIQKLSKTTLYGSSAPDIVAGLTEDASKSPSHFVPRTFVGILDQNQDGKFETLLIFNTMTARQSDAADVLKSFGAAKVMMLDGGGSTQLICEGKSYISSDRLIPQAIGVLAAPLPPFSATLATQPDWPVVMQNELIQVSIVLTNTGSMRWEPGNVKVVLDERPWGATATLDLSKPVDPGEAITFVWKPDTFSRQGVYSIRWYLSNGNDKFPLVPERFNLVVLSDKLVRERSGLLQEIADWQQMGVLNIDPLFKDWLQSQLRKRMQKNLIVFVKPPVSTLEKSSVQAGILIISLVILSAGSVYFLLPRWRNERRIRRRSARRSIYLDRSAGKKGGSDNNSSRAS